MSDKKKYLLVSSLLVLTLTSPIRANLKAILESDNSTVIGITNVNQSYIELPTSAPSALEQSILSSTLNPELQVKSPIDVSVSLTESTNRSDINVTKTIISETTPTGLVKDTKTNTTVKLTIIEEKNPEKNETIHKFCQYMKPICESINKISPKQMFKIQKQFKQFVQLTGGKLGLCFLDQFNFNPTIKPVTKEDLILICDSKNQKPELKGSHESFKKCAANIWDPSLDKELDKIALARQNGLKNQSLSNNDTKLFTLFQDEEEASLINEVVNKVIGSETGTNRSDIKLIDITLTTSKPLSGISSTPTPTTSVSTSVSVSDVDVKVPVKQVKETSSSPVKSSGLLNDTNTVIVLVDDSNSTNRHSTPRSTINKTKVEDDSSSGPISTLSPELKVVPTIKPLEPNKESKTNLTFEIISNDSTKNNSSLARKIVSVFGMPSTSPKPSTTSSPIDSTKITIITITTTKKPSPSSTTFLKIETSLGKGTTSPPSKTTAAPALVIEVGSSVKPTENLREIIKKLQKEKQELEAKLAERDKALEILKTKLDGINAQNAIKSLQAQREAVNNQKSDNRMHQLEHERQMSIDPIGHTIKHQQYELNKQQRLMAGRGF